MADVIPTGSEKSGTPGGATPAKAGVTTSEAVLKRYGVTIKDLATVTKTDYVPSPSMQHLKRQFFKEQSVSMSDGSLKFLPTDLVFAMHAVARGLTTYSYGHMRALMLWMTYLAGLENRRNEEYIQNLQNRLETGNRQLFKRNKYFFLPQNREVRRSKFAGSYDQSSSPGDDDIIVDEVIRATAPPTAPARGTPPGRARGRARGRGFGTPPSRGGAGPGFGGRPQGGPPLGSPPGAVNRGFPSPFERRGGPDRRGGLSGPPPPAAAASSERSPDLRGLRVLQSRNPPTSGPSFFGRLGGGAPLGIAAQQGTFKQPEISLMLDCEDDPLSPSQMDKYRKDVENYKITLKAQKYLNSNGPRNYSSNDYSNELPEPDDHDDHEDEAEEQAPPPPPPAAAPKSAQLALPAPPKGMKPGPRTAKLAQQLGKQGTEKSKSNLQYIVQNGKLVLVQGQAAPPVQMQLKTKGPPGKPASAQARSLPPRNKATKRQLDADFEPPSKTGGGTDAPVRTSSRARTATKAFDLSEIESEESAAKQKMSEETKKVKKVEKPEKAKSSSALTSKEAPGSKDGSASKDVDTTATAAVPTSKEAKQAAIRAAAKQGAILAAKAAKPKYVKPAGKGNWLPIHEYFYGRKNGDPAYVEQKGDFRFKCWHCEKMLYNNLKAVNHVIGHIDANKQKSVDFADLTSCQQCSEDFDSPFEMQCHAEKEHFSNQKLLMCRICDKNLQSEDGLKVHMSTVHVVCDMPYRCTLCEFRSSIYTDLVDHFKKRHTGSSNVICLYCTRIFTLQEVGTNEDSAYCRTQNFYIHLQKHQVNAMQKRCNACLLTFLSNQDLKAHRQAAHGANKVASRLPTFSKGDSTLIFVPERASSSAAASLIGSPSKALSESDEEPKVDADKDYAGMTLVLKQEIDCVECKSSMNQVAHYKKYVECGLCPFATSCSQAYNNHMTAFHAGEKNRVVPKDRPIANFEEIIDFGDDDEDDFVAALGGTPKEKPKKEPPRLPPVPWWCACGFSTKYGNDLCNHLIHCSRRTAYFEKPETRFVEIDAEIDESDDEIDGSTDKTSSSKTIFDALGLQPKVAEVAEEEESDTEMVAEEEEGNTGDVPEVQKAINKMLDKVCGKKKMDDEEDVATILRKPIDFTKSDKLEEPLEAENEEDAEEDDADSTELQGEIHAALRALEGGDKDSDVDSDKSSSWAADVEGKTDVAKLEDVAEADEPLPETKTKRQKKDVDDDNDEDYDEKMDEEDEEEDDDDMDEEAAMDDEEKEEKGLRTGGKRRMKKRVQRKIMDSDSDEESEGGGKRKKRARMMEQEEEEEEEDEDDAAEGKEGDNVMGEGRINGEGGEEHGDEKDEEKKPDEGGADLEEGEEGETGNEGTESKDATEEADA